MQCNMSINECQLSRAILIPQKLRLLIFTYSHTKDSLCFLRLIYSLDLLMTQMTMTARQASHIQLSCVKKSPFHSKIPSGKGHPSALQLGQLLLS